MTFPRPHDRSWAFTAPAKRSSFTRFKYDIIAKSVGILLIVVYHLYKPIRFEPVWLLVYIFISVSVPTAFLLLVRPVVHFVARRLQPDAHAKREAAYRMSVRALSALLRRRPYLVLLVPGEDGLVLVPLLAYGLGPVSAAVAALAFGAMHYNRPYTLGPCVSKAIACYISCLLVLPHGLLTVIVGHLCFDGMLVLLAMTDDLKDTTDDKAHKA